MADERGSVRKDPERPLGLVLSGGGARGLFQVGVWDVLWSDPRGPGGPPEVLSGTSAGALNGAMIAAGLTPKQLLQFWLDLARDPPVAANPKFFSTLRNALLKLALREPFRGFSRRGRELKILAGLVSKHDWYRQSGLLSMVLEFVLTARFDSVSEVLDGIQTTHLFDTSRMLSRIEKVLGKGGLRSTTTRLAINTVDMHTGRVVRLVNYRPEKRLGAAAQHYRYEPVLTPEMILASASIPLLFNPVRVGPLELWDGGLLVNTPMAPAVALGAKRIIPVLVTPRAGALAAEDKTMGAALERVADAFLENAYNADRKLLLDRNALAGKFEDVGFRRVELFRALRPKSSKTFNAGSYLYFEEGPMRAMFEAGRTAALEWLDRGPLLDDLTIEEE